MKQEGVLAPQDKRDKKMSDLLRHIKEKGFVLADGAIGTNLFAKGLETGDAPELWNVDEPEKVLELHREFVEAGADILLTNSFGANAFRLKLHNAQDKVELLNQEAVRLAKKAASEADRPVFVAGSLGPTGELFSPLGALSYDEAFAAFEAQAKAIETAGADALWIETMSSSEEMEACVKAAQTTALPVFATMTFDTAGRTMMGILPAAYAKQANELSLDAFGANCGIGPAELLDTVQQFATIETDSLIIAKGNCGIPEYVEGAIHYHGTPELMAEYAVCARAAGAQIIGGCCGTSPAHLRAMREALDRMAVTEIISAQDIEARLGKPWANLAQSDEGQAAKPARGRRRARKGEGGA